MTLMTIRELALLEREALKDKDRTRAKMLNVCKSDIRRIPSPVVVAGSSSAHSLQLHQTFRQSQISPIEHEGRAPFVGLSDIGGENVQSGLPASLPLEIPSMYQEQVPILQPPVERHVPVLDNLASSLSDLLNSDTRSTSTSRHSEESHNSIFLGFQWALGGRSHCYFCFTVLPFGLSSAP